MNSSSCSLLAASVGISSAACKVWQMAKTMLIISSSMLVIAMLAVLLGTVVGASAPPATAHEAQALMAFKKGITSDPFGRLASWDISNSSATTDPCQEQSGGVAAWTGIVCDAQRRHVTGVNLANFNLSGSISSSLALLPALSHLDLSDNLLSGALPSNLFIPNSALQYLNLSYNFLDGALPASLANLSALLTLDLSNNLLVGEIPASLGQCKRLKRLYLEETGLTGTIPTEIWQLPTLIVLAIVGQPSALLDASLPDKFASCPTIRFLGLSNIDATSSPFPSSLGDCQQLRVLWLDVIGLEGFIPPETWQLPLLRELVVQDSQVVSIIDNSNDSPFKLHGSLPSTFACCPTITVLSIDGINLTGEIPPSLGQCTVLQYLDLSHSSLEGVIPQTLSNLSNLEILYLQSNQLVGTIPELLFHYSGLLELRLGDNVKLTGPIPREVGKLKQLEELSLFSTSLLGPVPEELCNCTELAWLDVGWTKTQGGVGKLPDCIAKLAQLQTLGWQFNAINGEVPMKVLKNLTQLQYLDISFANIVGTIPPELGNLSMLHHLGFQANSLTGSIPPELGQLPHIQLLEFSRNSLNGSLSEQLFLNLANGGSITQLFLSVNELQGVIPSSIGGLQKLQALYLLQNQIEGRIPSTLGNCTALQDLVLANNRLEGVIPPSLGQLTGLNANLLLSENLLSGEIPRELGALTQLKVLDLSKNQLIGHVPGSIENCSNLKILRLFQNGLTGRIEQFDLSKLQQLQIFTVYQNHFIGGLPSGFTSSQNLLLLDVQKNNLSGPLAPSDTALQGAVTGLSNLRVLVMSSNKLSGEIPMWVWKLPMLQVLDLSNNQLRGTMPATVTHLSYFKQDQTVSSNQTTLYEEVPQIVKFTFQVLSYILNNRVFFDVSMNYLEGEIAESFGELLGLTGLILSHNNIEGKVPSSLGKLMNLDELDLSHNNLGGAIPPELGLVGGLSMVDLSYNNLQGPIPTANNFNTRFPMASFEHNPGLCGSPLPVNCSTPNMAHTETSPPGRGFSLVEWIESFASPWALLVAYPIGFLGSLYFCRLLRCHSP